jgi:hypothetical protein
MAGQSAGQSEFCLDGQTVRRTCPADSPLKCPEFGPADKRTDSSTDTSADTTADNGQSGGQYCTLV